MKQKHQASSRTVWKTVGITCLAGAVGLMSSVAAAATIHEAGSWPGYTRHTPEQVFGESTNAYLAVAGGLQILDLSTPTEPQVRSFLQCLGAYEHASDIHSQSNRLCMGIVNPKQIRGIDISNLDQPVLAWTAPLYKQPNHVCMDHDQVYSSHNAGGLSVGGWGDTGYADEHHFVTNAWGRVVIKNNRLYAPTAFGFQIFTNNLVSPAWGGLVGTFNAGAEVKALAVEGDHVYLAAEDGLRVVDVQNESAPSQVGSLPLAPGDFLPMDVQLLPDHASLIFKNTNILMVVDITTPTAPTHVGSYAFTGPTKDLSVSDGRALVLAAEEQYGSPDLHVLDLTTPANPTFVSRLYALGKSDDLAIQGSTLFVADGNNGLCMLDVGTPSDPEIIGHDATQGNCLAVTNDRAYLGKGMSYSVFDVSTPESPVLVTNAPGWNPVGYLEAHGDYLYRIEGWPGSQELVVVNVTNNLAEAGRRWLGEAGAFSMAGNCFALFVDAWLGSLMVIDVQTAGFPTLTNYLGAAEIVDVVGRADGAGTNAFLATTNGMEILDLSDTNNVSRIASWVCPSGYVPNCICVDGGRIGLASTNHLWIIDINEIGGADPVLAETDITNTFSDMILSGNHLYAAAGADGVIVYQIGSTVTQPSLFISRNPPDQVTLEWDSAGTGWHLQQNDEPANPDGWAAVAGSDMVTRTNLPMTVPARLFRLKQP